MKTSQNDSGKHVELEGDWIWGEAGYGFLGIPDYDKSNHFIASTFIRQVYYVNVQSAVRKMENVTGKSNLF